MKNTEEEKSSEKQKGKMIQDKAKRDEQKCILCFCCISGQHFKSPPRQQPIKQSRAVVGCLESF